MKTPTVIGTFTIGMLWLITDWRSLETVAGFMSVAMEASR